jgi:glycosyltransferase involved in cell wall biosynthesis/GT2 family glycosyltransferase
VPDDMQSSSVIIAAYNNAAYIGAALDSVLDHTPDDTEIIVVDDGSTDGTTDVLRGYRGRITSLYQENRGPAAARNLGLRHSSGRYIRFVDSDDVILPGSQFSLLSAISDAPDSGAVHSGWEIIDCAGTVIGASQPWHCTPQLQLRSWLTTNPVLLGAMLFRREWLELVQGFDEQFRRSEDTDLLLRLALAGCQMSWLRKSTIRYRQHSSSLSRDPVQAQIYSESLLDKFFATPDLPADIRSLEASCRFYRRIWVGARLYFAGNVPAAREKLLLSLSESPLDSASTVQEWYDQFGELQLTEPESPLSSEWPTFLADLATTDTTRKRLRICFVVESFESFGGMEEIITELAIALKARGHDILILSTIWTVPSNQYCKKLNRAGIRIVHLPANALIRLAAIVTAYVPALIRSRSTRSARDAYSSSIRTMSQDTAWRFLLSPVYKAVASIMLRLSGWIWRPDLVHFHAYTYKVGLTFLLTTTRALRLPSLFQEHQTPDVSAPQWSEFREEINQVTAVAAVSQKSADVLQHLLDVKVPVHVVNPIVSVNRAATDPQTQEREETFVRLVCIARLIPVKGLIYLIEAFVQLLERNAAIELHIYGDGPLLDELVEKAGALGVDGNTIFRGAFKHSDLGSILCSAHIFVLPSLTEGLPLAVIEAMAHGMPIVASHVGGIPELIDDRCSGLLCRPGNTDDLADALWKLIQNPQLRSVLGENARRKFESTGFSTAQVLSHFEEIYQKVLAAGVGKVPVDGAQAS